MIKKRGVISGLILSMALLLCFGMVSCQTSQDLTKDESTQGKKGLLQQMWETQAMSVAADMGIANEQTEKLINTYVAARLDLQTSVKELPGTENKEENEAAKDELYAAYRANITKSLKEFLSEEQASDAAIVLGSLNSRWDRYVKFLMGCNLDADKMKPALKAVNSYISGYQKARNEADASGGRISSVVSKELKKNLDDNLQLILSEQQVAEWNEISAMGKKKESSD